MYKVNIDTLEKLKSAMKLTSNMLEASHKGSKLEPKQVEKVLKNNIKLVKLLEDNYHV